jgi:Zn-dependent protease with chaperone function
MKQPARDYLDKHLAAREQTRRRTLLLGIGVLIILSTSPVFGHHLMRGGESLLRGTDRIGELCLVALHLLLAPVHELFHVLLVAGIAIAVWDRARAWLRLRRTLKPLQFERPRAGDPIWSAACHANVDPSIIHTFEDAANPAFTAGWWRPSIYLSRRLADSMTPAELSALLAHEAAHVARRDPFRLSLLRFVGRTLFWLPALRRLAADVADEAEIEADDRAAADQPLVLASAILSVARWSQARVALELAATGAVGFAQGDLVERRVRRLVGEDVPVRSRVTRRSVLSATGVLALVWTSGVLMTHPLPAGGYGAHAGNGAPASRDCTHHDGLALLHLFCPGISFGSSHYHCPHLDSRT